MVDVGICSECGREVVGRDTFCGGCGARVTPAPDGLEAWARDDVRDLLLERLRETTIGEYEVRGVIGRGGMASVFAAYDLTLNRRVALKAMHPGFLSDSGMRERFRQEARLAARLDHPNIVTVHAVKERGGIVFFDLKLVEGTSLDRLVRHRAAPLSVELACWSTAKIAEALYYAHQQSVIHRDMKPANVMVDQRGDLIVTDFGIAKAAESPQLTMTGTIVGTPAYMSPEQCLGKEITAASDQYSLGILAYELLTGAAPFSGSMLAIQLGHVEKQAPSPRDIVRDVPETVSSAVMRMIAKNPADRWPSLAVAAEALLEGVHASEAQMRREMSALVSAMPDDLARRQLPQTPRSPTPAFNASPNMGLTEMSDRVQDADTEVLPMRRRSTPFSATNMRARALPLGAVIAASIAIVAIIGMQGGGERNAQIGRTDSLAAKSGPIGVESTASGVLNDQLERPDSVVKRVGIFPLDVTLRVGDSVRLKATAFGPSGESIPRKIRWMSDSAQIVSVNGNGWIFAHARTRGGPVAVTATADDRAGATYVTVK